MIDFAVPFLFGFFLVFLRTLGLCLTAPITASPVVSIRIRLGLGFAAGIAIYSGAGMPRVFLPGTFIELAGMGVAETAVGLTAGLCARFMIEAAQAAGQVAGMSAGLGYGALIDPFNGVASSVTGQLMSTLAISYAVAANAHGEAIAWLCRSVVEYPPGKLMHFSELAGAVITNAAWACALSIRLSFPFMAAGLLAQGTLWILNRAAPQLSISNIGFSISLLAGGYTVYFAAPEAAKVASRAAISIFGRG